MEDGAYRLASVAIFTAGVSMSIRHRLRADREGGKVSLAAEPLHLLIPLRVAGLLFLASYVTWLANPAWTAWASVPIPAAVRWLGAVVGAACVPLIWWVFTSLGRNVSPTVLTRKRHQLVTHGPYRWVRHPLYTVGAAAWLSLGLLMANAFMLLLGATAFLILRKRTEIEEAKLLDRFGVRYRRYMARTGRFLPGWITAAGS